MQKKRYPRTLSIGANNRVVALSDTEVGKLFPASWEMEMKKEQSQLIFSNGINDLVVKFIRLDYDDAAASNMIVLERLYPVDFRAYELEKRELWFDVFRDELQQLHRAGFVHRDLQRPDDRPGMPYDNIFLTPKGIRLIDVGISIRADEVEERLFKAYVQQELDELEDFRHFFLNR